MPRRKSRSVRAQRRKTVLHGRGGEAGEAFRCVGCRRDVPLWAPGTAHRNHCPHCLASKHVDGRIPGDRAATCRGRMDAVSLSARDDGEWLLVHRCVACGTLKANRIAGDDNALALLRLAMRPLADPRPARQALLAL
ncbi:RNHCP domain-containing protein [Nocardia puris]|uniref:RNHCP domain-containing protein n=1 Tax=Nocardia puris TaxID=208602 RepID=A0A366DSL5_9NOCA|nr:RNHCP domain-containing protein [Nocardia puris]MBF6215281.1 RNHCP domain-containing protein [Nocardia puris]MBF6364222.1 RNHCP domain-containing protein [Nocardia puris]MBF6459151.1 RNHCP domain-containing protein [Nocardia puris]RBO92895.1 RNHCP domain-containing protein [Nocardia puris]